MGAIAALEPSALSVEPGAETTATLRVRNTGTVVDEFTFEVLGPPASWARVEPAVLRLLPGMEEQVRVVLHPPRSADVQAGALPFGVKVLSKEDPAGSVVEEGTLSVGTFVDTFAELLPRTSRGRRRTRHELAFDNRSNQRINADLAAADPDELLDFEIDPPALVAEPGAAAFAKVKVKPRKRFWRGPPLTRPFQVSVLPLDAPPMTVDGSLLQEAVLPKWLPKAVLLALAAILALLLLWLLLLRPSIESAARDAVEEPLAEQAAAIQQLQEDVAAGGGGGPPPEPEPSPEPSPGSVVDPTEPVLVTVPFDLRLSVTDSPGGLPSRDVFEVPEGQTLALTDLVLQNPRGHTGELRVLRDTQVLLVVALENFRDLDYHFVTPLTFLGGQELVLSVQCQVPTAPATQCDAGAYLSGEMTRPPDEESAETEA